VSLIDSSYKTQTGCLTLPSVVEMPKWPDAPALREREALVKFLFILQQDHSLLEVVFYQLQ
jgi:hypothetical protein